MVPSGGQKIAKKGNPILQSVIPRLMVKYPPKSKINGNTVEDIHGAFEPHKTLRAEHPTVACTHHIRHGQSSIQGSDYTTEQKAAYAGRLVNALTARVCRVIGMDKDHVKSLYADDPSNGGDTHYKAQREMASINNGIRGKLRNKIKRL
jgi:hypothetical protein